MIQLTSRTRPTTKTAATATPTTMTCTGFSSATSRSRSRDLRTPKNDQATARTVRSSEPRRGAGGRSLPSTGWAIMSALRRHLAADLEEGVREGDGLDVLRKLRVDHEHHRPLLRLAGLEQVLAEAEAFELVEVRHRHRGRIARNGLRRHGAVLLVAELVHHGRHLARVHRDRRLGRLEVPGPAGIGVELDGHGAAQVDLTVRGQRPGAGLQLGD